MPINPIAMQVKPASTSGMLNTLAAIRQMQTAGQQQQMNQLAIEKAQREKAESEAFKNALSQFDYSTPEGMANIIKQSPTLGLGLQKNAAALRASQTSAQLNEEKLAKSRNEYFQTQATRIQNPKDAARYFDALFKDPILGPRMQQIDSFENAINSIPTDPQKFQGFVRQLAGGPMALENMYKEQSAKDLAAQGQRATDARTKFNAQVSMARDIIKEATYVDQTTGQVVRNPQISDEQLAAAEQFANVFGGGGAAPGGQPMPTDPNAPPLPPAPSGQLMPTDLNAPVEGIRTLEMRPTDQAVPTKLPTVPGQEATRTPLGQRGVLSQEELPNARMMAIENKATAQKRADLKINHPQTVTGLNAIRSDAEKTVAAIDRILTDPALENVTGNWDGSAMFEGINGLLSQASRNVQSDIKFLESRAFLGGLTKGVPGLAPISEAEGKTIQASEANLDKAQDTKKMEESLIDYKIGIIRAANAKVREYNETFKDLGVTNWKPAPLYIPRESAEQLLATRRTRAHINEFNKQFGEGAAEQVLKGATNGR